MLGKLVNGQLIVPTENEFKKIIIVNPTESQLKSVMGYKDLIIDDEPPISDGYQLKPVYEETDNLIIQHWELEEIIVEENIEEEI